MVFVSQLVPAAVMVVKLTLDIVPMIQAMFYVAMILPVPLMMEEKVLAYILVNAVEVQSMENAQEAQISNAVFQVTEAAVLWIRHMVCHAMEVVFLHKS